MSTKAAANLPATEFMLTVLTGPEAGVAYKLIGQAVTLGRSSENDVVIQDNKSSRNHAIIERRGSDFWIVDLGSTAGLMVNEVPVKEQNLQSGDLITIGTTVFRFGRPEGLSLIQAAPPLPAASPMPQLPLTKNLNIGAPSPDPSSPWAQPAKPRRSRGPQKNYLPMVLIAAIILGFIFLSQKHTGTGSGFKVKDEALLDQEIQATTETNDQKQQQIFKAGKDTQQYAEAQAFYLRGSREFRAGNYNRAAQEFQTALSIYPNHPLARRYLEESRIKNNQMVSDSLERAEKAFQLEKYRLAKSEYKNVIRLSGDPNNKSYQLANKRLETIELILQNNM